MRLRLILMRHAKSDWDSEATSDFDRSLNHRGRGDAPRIAGALADRHWVPDLVLSSSSRRTRETWDLMQKAWAGPIEVHFLDELYHGGPTELAAALIHLPDQVRTVLALGHNPGWQQAVHAYSGESCTLTTANAALLEIEAENWHKVSRPQGQWQLLEILRPKEL